MDKPSGKTNHDGDFVYGSFESVKFNFMRESYYKGVEKIKELNYTTEDFIHHFPCFTGHLTLTRFLTLYELYKLVQSVPGHIAEVGVYKGASSIFFAKLVQIYESNALTQVHGFDWFKGSEPGEMEKNIIEGSYSEDYNRVVELVECQRLNHILHIHKMDIRTELKGFFEKNPYMQFKLVFLDAGTYENVKACLPLFWNHVVKGGIIIFDQFNHELAPGETIALKELLPEQEIHTISNSWMPNAYIRK